VIQPLIGFILSRSTPILILAIGIYLAATCNLYFALNERMRDLPTTWSCAEINETLGIAEEIEFFIKLNKLEGGTRAITLLLGHVIELIQPIL
jgi:hypothetical protein